MYLPLEVASLTPSRVPHQFSVAEASKGGKRKSADYKNGLDRQVEKLAMLVDYLKFLRKLGTDVRSSAGKRGFSRTHTHF